MEHPKTLTQKTNNMHDIYVYIELYGRFKPVFRIRKFEGLPDPDQ
jgi:hypothetical protein